MDVFREVDRDGTGFLDMQNIKEMTIRLGQPLPDDRVKEIFDRMDKNKDGKVEAEEFMEWFSAEETKEGIKNYFHQKTLQIFKEIDTDMSGFLDVQELEDIAIRIGANLPKKRLQKIFKEMDKNKDGKIEVDEFIAWMDKDMDDTGFRRMLSGQMGLGGTGWLNKKGGGGSFLG